MLVCSSGEFARRILGCMYVVLHVSTAALANHHMLGIRTTFCREKERNPNMIEACDNTAKQTFFTSSPTWTHTTHVYACFFLYVALHGTPPPPLYLRSPSPSPSHCAATPSLPPLVKDADSPFVMPQPFLSRGKNRATQQVL